MKYFQIKKGLRSQNWKTGKEEFNGNFSTIDFDLDSLDDCFAIIKIAKIKSWEIYTGEKEKDRSYINWDYKPAVQSPDVIAFNKKSKTDKKDHDTWRERQVKAINKLPEYFDTSFKEVRIKRHEYSYKSSYSRNLSGYISFETSGKFDTSFKDEYMKPSDFKTKAGSLQVKKFSNDWGSWKKVCGNNPNMTPRGILLSLIDSEESVKTIIAHAMNNA